MSLFKGLTSRGFNLHRFFWLTNSFFILKENKINISFSRSPSSVEHRSAQKRKDAEREDLKL
jgi:hypothetical protein